MLIGPVTWRLGGWTPEAITAPQYNATPEGGRRQGRLDLDIDLERATYRVSESESCEESGSKERKREVDEDLPRCTDHFEHYRWVLSSGNIGPRSLVSRRGQASRVRRWRCRVLSIPRRHPSPPSTTPSPQTPDQTKCVKNRLIPPSPS